MHKEKKKFLHVCFAAVRVCAVKFSLICASCLVIFTPLFSSEYVLIDFTGGQFGNQLFQIAAALSLAIDHEAQAIFPQLLEQKNAGLPKNYREVFYRLDVSNPVLKRKKIYGEPHYHYAPIPFWPNIVLKGYFQSEKYFKHNREAILPLFYPSNQLMDYLQKKYGHRLSQGPTVGVHLRSYLVENSSLQKHFPTYGVEYYEKAMAHFPEDALFLICSNDIKWAKQLLRNIPKKMEFIEGNDYLQDFYLLSLCDHQIISNSTFSWWAAYLNRNPDKKVIAPPYYFRPGYRKNDKDLFPEDWQKISDLQNPFLPIRMHKPLKGKK